MMKRFAFLAMALTMVPAAHADEFSDEAHKLIEVSHVLDAPGYAMEMMLEGLVPTLRDQVAESLAAAGRRYEQQDINIFGADFRARANASFTDRLRTMLTDRYRQNFTLAEMRELTALMSAPALVNYNSRMSLAIAVLQASVADIGGSITDEVLQDMMADYPMLQ